MPEQKSRKSTTSRPRRRAQKASATSSPTSTTSSLDWRDRAACEAWLEDLSGCIGDLVAVGEDQSARFRSRKLGPAEARRLLAEARLSLADLMAFARAGLATS